MPDRRAAVQTTKLSLMQSRLGGWAPTDSADTRHWGGKTSTTCTTKLAHHVRISLQDLLLNPAAHGSCVDRYIMCIGGSGDSVGTHRWVCPENHHDRPVH